MKSNFILLSYLLVFLFLSKILAQPNFGKHTIFYPLNIAKKVSIGDIDRDGDMDVAAVASNQNSDSINVIWFEDIDGTQNYHEHVISTNYWDARAVCVGDLVEGGYLEIVTGARSRRRLTVWQYDTINDIWIADSSFTTSSPNNYSICITDLNSDSYLDIVTTFGPTTNGVYWFQGDGSGNFEQRTISERFENAVDLDVGNIDNDDYKDIVTVGFIATGENVQWLKNDGTPENGGWTVSVIEQNYNQPNTVDLADIDNDGDLDILSAEFFAANVSWWANNGNGSFGNEQPTPWVAQIRSVRGEDIDGDGDTDVLAAADINNRISWFENNGNLAFTERIITDDFTYAYFTIPFDLDGDGDVDVIGSAQGVTPHFSGEIAWWENDLDDDQLIAGAGSGTFWNGNVVINFSSGPADSVTVFYNAGKTPDKNSLGLGIDHIAERGYYTITTQKSSYDAGIDFHYGSGYVPEWSAIDNEDELVICFWDDTNSEWVIAGTSQTVDADNDSVTVNGISEISLTNFRPFSKWTIGSRTSDNPLPVQLLAFSAEILTDGIKLNWSTASEINNVGFEIWRSEVEDSNYVLLSDYRSNVNLVGAGNSNQLRNYSYTDISVRDNFTYWYKLIDVDVNNQKTIHGPLEVTFIRISIASSFQLAQNYPNPFNGYTKIPIYLKSQTLSGSASGTLRIFNLLGEQIKNFDLNLLSSGKNEIQWDGKDNFGNTVASGQYFYRVNLNGESQSRKLILIR